MVCLSWCASRGVRQVVPLPDLVDVMGRKAPDQVKEESEFPEDLDVSLAETLKTQVRTRHAPSLQPRRTLPIPPPLPMIRGRPPRWG